MCILAFNELITYKYLSISLPVQDDLSFTLFVTIYLPSSWDILLTNSQNFIVFIKGTYPAGHSGVFISSQLSSTQCVSPVRENG